MDPCARTATTSRMLPARPNEPRPDGRRSAGGVPPLRCCRAGRLVRNRFDAARDRGRRRGGRGPRSASVAGPIQPRPAGVPGRREPRDRSDRRGRPGRRRRGPGDGRRGLRRPGHGQPRRGDRRGPACRPRLARDHRGDDRGRDPLEHGRRSGSATVDGGSRSSSTATRVEDADVIIPINRVKPHTDFSGPVESGLLKMIAIGLGKQRRRRHVPRPGLRDRSPS